MRKLSKINRSNECIFLFPVPLCQILMLSYCAEPAVAAIKSYVSFAKVDNPHPLHNCCQKGQTSMKDRCPFKGEFTYSWSKWTKTEGSIQYLRELTMLKVIHNNLCDDQHPKTLMKSEACGLRGESCTKCTNVTTHTLVTTSGQTWWHQLQMNWPDNFESMKIISLPTRAVSQLWTDWPKTCLSKLRNSWVILSHSYQGLSYEESAVVYQREMVPVLHTKYYPVILPVWPWGSGMVNLPGG